MSQRRRKAGRPQRQTASGALRMPVAAGCEKSWGVYSTGCEATQSVTSSMMDITECGWLYAQYGGRSTEIIYAMPECGC